MERAYFNRQFLYILKTLDNRRVEIRNLVAAANAAASAATVAAGGGQVSLNTVIVAGAGAATSAVGAAGHVTDEPLIYISGHSTECGLLGGHDG